MALSDEEQRRLDEIERSFQTDNAAHRGGVGRRTGFRFAAVDAVDDARQRRRVAACAVLGIGMAVLLTGLILTRGSAAFGAMVAAVGLVIMTGAAALFLWPGRRG